MTYKEWSARPDLISDLATLLAHPTMQIALAVCTDVGLPRTKFPSNTPNLIENHALANAKHEGYFEFPKILRALATQKPGSPEEDKMVPWKYKSEQLED
jgi:hypothetical protein